MRRALFVVGLLCLSAAIAAAQGKVSSSSSCPGSASGQSYEVGDQPNHWYGLAQFKCTATSGEVSGVKDKEGTGTEFHEVTGDKSSGHGIFVATMANGDHVHYAYTSSVNLTKGMMTTGSNKFEITGGTGKFKAIKGKGGCTGKGNADGSSTWTCTGTYTGVK
jgi:hypothetical protein